MKISKETLSMLSGIQDELLLQTLVDLRIGPDNIVALALIPLIAIAWADGKIDMKEQNALLLATVYCGMKKGTIDYRLFADWIQLKPAPILLRAWAQYVRHLCESLPPDDNKKMKSEIIGRARSVAEASGGILGYRIGDRISRNEQAVLARLRRAFIR